MPDGGRPRAGNLIVEDDEGRPQLRDLRALARFELFLFTSVATILVVRGALAVSGYPQVGGSSGLHVAHVLYGGLLMGVAIVMMEILPGGRNRVRAAFIGGIGFGLFLDEVGKFLTKDVNYFYKPAVSVMYAVLVLFFVVVHEVIAHRPLHDRRRLALAALATSDLALGQLDERGRSRAVLLLEGVEPEEVADAIRTSLTSDLCTKVPRLEAAASRTGERIADAAERVLRSAQFRVLIGVLLGLQFVGVLAELLLILIQPALGRSHGSHVTDVGAVVATIVSLVYVGFGAERLARGNQLGALRVLSRSAMVSVLFTQLFVFARYQWSGLLGFFGALLILGGVRAVMHVVQDADDLGFDRAGTLVSGGERPRVHNVAERVSAGAPER